MHPESQCDHDSDTEYRLLEVAFAVVHVRAKLCKAKCSASWVMKKVSWKQYCRRYRKEYNNGEQMFTLFPASKDAVM